MQTILFWTAATLYAVSTALFFVWFAFRKDRAGSWAWALSMAGLVPHGVTVGLRWAEVGHGPWSTRYEVLSSSVFLLVAIYGAVAVLAPRLRALGALIMPLAFLVMGWAVMTFGLKNEVPIIFKSYWLALHIGVGPAFVVCALLAAACAAAYLVKLRSRGSFARLPTAEELELYAHQFVLVAFLFLGVMIVAGSLWAQQSWGRYWGWDPIETSALVTWIVFGLILHFRVLHGWTGRRMAYLTFVGFGFAVMTMYVVVMIVPTIHNSYMVGK